jgi:FkbM family methyltransferase
MSWSSRARRLLSFALSRRARDLASWRLLLGRDSSGVADVHGVSIEYDLSSVVGRALLLEGGFEDAEIEFFLRRLRRHQRPVVVDIGANIGVHTLRWAAGAPGAHVHSFEPSPETRARLVRNVERNGLQSSVTVEPLAVSDAPGQARFYHCRDGAFSSLRDTGRQELADAFDVEVTTLDAFAATRPLDDLALVKIDVEGFEDQVIAGGRRTLESLRPDLFVEIYGGTSSNPDPELTVATIQGLGYRAFVLVDGEPVPFERHSDDRYNYFFTK